MKFNRNMTVFYSFISLVIQLYYVYYSYSKELYLTIEIVYVSFYIYLFIYFVIYTVLFRLIYNISDIIL